MNNEPILIGLAPGLITGLVAAVANVGRAFGLDISQEQIDAINASVLPVMLVLFALGGWWARRNATPVANPTVPSGTIVNVQSAPDGTGGGPVTV